MCCWKLGDGYAVRSVVEKGRKEFEGHEEWGWVYLGCDGLLWFVVVCCGLLWFVVWKPRVVTACVVESHVRLLLCLAVPHPVSHSYSGRWD
jgi:hypothetical protein